MIKDGLEFRGCLNAILLFEVGLAAKILRPEIAEDIVAREGGFVNDPADPGGATNFGVTIGTMRGLGLDLNHNGKVDVADVRDMTRAEAVRVFISHYYTRVGIALLPDEVQASVFDMYVNSGANAVKILQRMLAKAGFDCRDDGAIGPATVKAAQAFAKAQGQGQINNRYGVARRDYYYALGDARPASRKYALRRDGGKGGWIQRAEAFIDPEFRLTDAEHQHRVAGWKP